MHDNLERHHDYCGWKFCYSRPSFDEIFSQFKSYVYYRSFDRLVYWICDNKCFYWAYELNQKGLGSITLGYFKMVPIGEKSTHQKKGKISINSPFQNENRFICYYICWDVIFDGWKLAVSWRQLIVWRNYATQRRFWSIGQAKTIYRVGQQ